MFIPEISIVVAVHNSEKYLTTCLNSILSQNFHNFEIICVNNGSDDESYNILTTYKDPRVKVISDANKLGPGKAKNLGITHATGKYLMVVDSDDYLMPGALAVLSKLMKKTNATMLQFGYQEISNNECFIKTYKKLNFKKYKKNFYKLLPYVNPSAFNKIFKTDLFKRLGLNFTNSLIDDVVPVYSSLLSESKKIVILKNKLYIYRIHASSLTNSISKNKYTQYINDQLDNLTLLNAMVKNSNNGFKITLAKQRKHFYACLISMLSFAINNPQGITNQEKLVIINSLLSTKRLTYDQELRALISYLVKNVITH